MKTLCRLITFFIMTIPAICLGQVNDIPVSASVCEKIINGESRASARVRASDKASFKAVEELPELSAYRTELDTHNFNLKVYRLVDNYLEDVKISTVRQENNQICVEINAYLPKSSVPEVFNAEEPEGADAIPDITEAEEMVLELEDDIDENISIAIPPKPEIIINKEISYNEEAIVAEKEPKQFAQTTQDNKKSITVFVEKTQFYNGSDTSGFFAVLEQIILQKQGFKAEVLPNNPDYVLKTKVLKAKVDNVNSETSRLQIVAALELTDAKSSETLTEHQNRFVLFNSSDDAQKVASNLTKKLLAAGTEKLLSKIKRSDINNSGGAVITPN